jgi:hypothetical protein
VFVFLSCPKIGRPKLCLRALALQDASTPATRAVHAPAIFHVVAVESSIQTIDLTLSTASRSALTR